MGRLREFIVEYVGNLHPSDHTDLTPPAPPADRRTNRYARELIDWIERQMEARGFPAAKKHELVNDLRKAFRTEWVANAEGVSRDAPS
jgi:hypothetical protein